MPRNYPSSVAQVVDPTMKFKPEALQAVRAFARSKPFRGTVEERHEKFREVTTRLSSAYGIQPPQLKFGSPDGDSRRSCYLRDINVIILQGMSVVTLLHEIGHAIHGRSEFEACRFSINLFRRCFPQSWSRVAFDGHLVRRRPKP